MSRTWHHSNNHRKFKDKHDKWLHEYKWWLRQEPKEWRRFYKHKKRRASVKDLVSKVKKGYFEQIWPLDKKPWIYYW